MCYSPHCSIVILSTDMATILCFFDFHEINESPRNTQYSVVEFLVSLQLSQFASTYAEICNEGLNEKRILMPREDFI